MRSVPLACALLAQALACGEPTAPGPPASSERERVLGPFLSEHWTLPVPPQGAPPAGFSAAEASLDPAMCGACHPEQYAQWQTSLHAQAFSPGFAGQLIEGSLSHPFQVRSCQTCHAPLAEQQPSNASLETNGAFDPELRAQGIVCASCHVRAHRHLGPPRRGDLPPLVEPVAHDGFEERVEYDQSRFCGPCHQFFDDAGANGKSVENTLFEWQASPQAEAGRHCQDCHMPDRAHLWRGIHDPEMVRSGVDVTLVPTQLEGPSVDAALVLANRDVGHAFPTYTTPRVFLAIYQEDAAGAEIAGTRLNGQIARVVNFGTMQEISDTRVLPGRSVKLQYRRARAEGAAALVGRVTVDPDYHYRGVFTSLLSSYRDPEARRLIAEALESTRQSRYVLSEIRRPLR